jgi:hypothetical protein
MNPPSKTRPQCTLGEVDYNRSMIVTFAVPPPSHMVCRP